MTIRGNISNEVFLDYVEMLWCAYFAVTFALLGTRLERAAALIYNMRIFGFYEVWLMLRSNPVYVSGAILDALFRCIAASTVAATAQRLYKADNIVQGWTIITIAAGYGIVCLDPVLRKHAECSEEAGPPTEDFPHGAWLDCEDWVFAYFVTWAYAGAKYIMLGIVGCCAYLIRGNETCIRVGTQLSVAMVATSAAATATRAFVRRLELDPYEEIASVFLDLCFYIYLVFFFCLQECIYRATKNCCSIKICLALGGCLFVLAAAPLYLMEWMLTMIEQKVISMNQQDHSDDEKVAFGKSHSQL